MKRMTVPAIVVAGVLAFMLAGCSGSGGGASQTMTEDTLKGVWSLDSQTDMGFDAYASFEDDSLFEMYLADSYLDGEWSVSGTDGSVTTSDDRTVKLSYSNDKLTMGAADGSKLVFVKDDSEEAKELFEYGDIEGLTLEDGDLEGLTLEGDDPEAEGVEAGDLDYVDEVQNPIDPVTVADDSLASIVVTAKGTDFTGDPCYWLTITNKTDKAVYFVADEEFTVGGKAIDPGIGEELEAGETLETTIYFPADELGGGLEALTSVDGVIVMYDDDTDEELAHYAFHMD